MNTPPLWQNDRWAAHQRPDGTVAFRRRGSPLRRLAMWAAGLLLLPVAWLAVVALRDGELGEDEQR